MRRCACRPAPPTWSSPAVPSSMSQAEHYVLGARWGLRGADARRSGAASGAAASRPAASTIRCRAACWRRPRTCAATSRSPASEQDEFAVAFARNARSRAQECGHLRRRDRAGHGQGPQGRCRSSTLDEHIRAPTRRSRSLAALTPDPGQVGPGRHGDRGQRERPERRRRRLHRDHAREGRSARPEAARPPGQLGGRRRRARAHGHRPGAVRRPRRSRVPGLTDVGHGPDRAQRGLRRTGPGLHASPGVSARRTTSG